MKSFIISPNIIRMIKMGEVCGTYGRDYESVQKSWPENLKGRQHSKYLDVDGIIILEWILEKYGGISCAGFI